MQFAELQVQEIVPEETLEASIIQEEEENED
jgi:hypothetical protein